MNSVFWSVFYLWQSLLKWSTLIPFFGENLLTWGLAAGTCNMEVCEGRPKLRPQAPLDTYMYVCACLKMGLNARKPVFGSLRTTQA